MNSSVIEGVSIDIIKTYMCVVVVVLEDHPSIVRENCTCCAFPSDEQKIVVAVVIPKYESLK